MAISIDSSQLTALTARATSSRKIVGARVSAAVRKTAFDIERDAKALAPVDTGNLRASISTDITGDGNTGTITALIGPTADYGIYQELGTSRMAPQPYLGPAFDRRIGPLEAALGQIGATAL